MIGDMAMKQLTSQVQARPLFKVRERHVPDLRSALRLSFRRLYAIRRRAFPADYTRTYDLEMNGLLLTVLPGVFHPEWHFTSGFLAEMCRPILAESGADVLEVGAGCGVVALSAA